MRSRGSPVQGQSTPVCHQAALEVALTCLDLGMNGPYPCSQIPIPFYTYSVWDGLSSHRASSVPGPVGSLAATPGHKGSMYK